MPQTASGAVRVAAGRLANHGQYQYRNQYQQVIVADLSDYMERSGFFGAHGQRIIHFAIAHLQPGDWAIDAGANVGLIAGPMAAAVGPTGCVWAIEPLPSNGTRLQALKDVNGLRQLEVMTVALGSTEATSRLHGSLRPGGSGSGSFVAPWASHESVEVAMVRLDDLVARRAPDAPLRLVKIDVEGSEPDLLAGAGVTLTKHRPLVICEFHDPLLRAAGSSSEDLLASFSQLGYGPQAPFARPRRSLQGRVCDLLLVPDEARSRHGW